MFLWLLVTIIHVFIVRELSPQSVIIFIPSMAYLVSHYLLLIRRKWIAEMMLWIFMISLVSMNLLTQYGSIRGVDFQRMFPKPSPYAKSIKDKKVLVLCDDVSVYRENKLAGYFPNWDLSKLIFEQPEYYESILLINEAFEMDPPDIIVDPQDLMKPIFNRIPRLKPLYRREGELYRKKE